MDLKIRRETVRAGKTGSRPASRLIERINGEKRLLDVLPIDPKGRGKIRLPNRAGSQKKLARGKLAPFALRLIEKINGEKWLPWKRTHSVVRSP